MKTPVQRPARAGPPHRRVGFDQVPEWPLHTCVISQPAQFETTYLLRLAQRRGGASSWRPVYCGSVFPNSRKVRTYCSQQADATVVRTRSLSSSASASPCADTLDLQVSRRPTDRKLPCRPLNVQLFSRFERCPMGYYGLSYPASFPASS